MKPLKEIHNYIAIHNGKIIDQSIQEEIAVDDTTITISKATDLQIVYTTDKEGAYEVTILCQQGNTIDLIENYSFGSTTNYVKNIEIKQRTKVNRYVGNMTDSNCICDIVEHITVEKDGQIQCAYVELSASQTKVTGDYHLVGQNATAMVRLAAVSKQQDKKHYIISIEHLAPHTIGQMDNYGIVQDQSYLYIDGIGTVKKGNYQSSSFQINKILVFDEGCHAKANPYLYIDEFDVKAGHGASVGKIDEEQLYYLQSRGLSRQDASHLVTYGYFLPILEWITNEELKDQFNTSLKEKVSV